MEWNALSTDIWKCSELLSAHTIGLFLSQCFYTVSVLRSCWMADFPKKLQIACLKRQILNALNFCSLCMYYCVVSMNIIFLWGLFLAYPPASVFQHYFETQGDFLIGLHTTHSSFLFNILILGFEYILI